MALILRIILAVVLSIIIIYSSAHLVGLNNKSLGDCYRSMQSALDYKDQEKARLIAEIRVHASRDLDADRKLFIQELLDLKNKREADVSMVKENILLIRRELSANQKIMIDNQEKILAKLSRR